MHTDDPDVQAAIAHAVQGSRDHYETLLTARIERGFVAAFDCLAAMGEQELRLLVLGMFELDLIRRTARQAALYN